MNARPKISALVVLAALGGAALPAAAETVIYTTTDEPIYYTPRVTYEANPYYVPPAVHVAPDTTYVAPPVTYVAPRYVEPTVTVYGSRVSDDVAISDDVAYTLASDTRLSGNIGVDTYRGTTTLTGRVSTPGQKDIAARDASSVDGVNEVQNHLRSRVGDY